MSAPLAFFCCAPSMGAKELILIAVLGFLLVGMPIWAWYRKQKLNDKNGSSPPSQS